MAPLLQTGSFILVASRKPPGDPGSGEYVEMRAAVLNINYHSGMINLDQGTHVFWAFVTSNVRWEEECLPSWDIAQW